MRSRTKPALFTTTSSRPKASRACSTSCPACAKSATSAPLAIASPPAPRISSTTSAAGVRSPPLPSRRHAEVVHHDPRALAREAERVLAPEAAPRPGHDRRRVLRKCPPSRTPRSAATAARGWSRSPGRRPRTWSGGRSGPRCARAPSSSVVMSRAPVAPIGWPSAIAPPFTFTFVRSAPSSFCQASTTEAKASLISTRSMSSSFMPAFVERVARSPGSARSACRSGRRRARSRWWTRARGSQPVLLHGALRCDEQGGGAVGDLARERGGEPAARLERLELRHASRGSCPGAGPRRRATSPTGAISLSKRPSSIARIARWWLSSAKRLHVLARDVPLLGDHLGAAELRDLLRAVARRPALRARRTGCRSRAAGRASSPTRSGSCSCSGRRPPRRGREVPLITACAAKCTACCEEPHWRSIVTPGTCSREAGREPAGARDVARLGPDRVAAAEDTSSTAPGSTPVRSTRAFSTWAPRSAGCTVESPPLRASRPESAPRRRCMPLPSESPRRRGVRPRCRTSSRRCSGAERRARCEHRARDPLAVQPPRAPGQVERPGAPHPECRSCSQV